MSNQVTNEELDMLIDSAYQSLPENVRKKLLYKDDDFKLGAKLVSPEKTTGYVVQFLTYVDYSTPGESVEKGVVWMFPGSSINAHAHMTDSECYQEVSENGFVLNGKNEKFVICAPGQSHQAEATENGTCIAWEWHEDGENLTFNKQNFEKKHEIVL